MIFSENTWLIVWTEQAIEFLEFSRSSRISRPALFFDSGSERCIYIYTYIRVCLAGNPRDEGEGKGVPVLIDGFRYVDVEFEWMVIKRGKGKGGREKKCAHSWLSFQVRSDANYQERERERVGQMTREDTLETLWNSV